MRKDKNNYTTAQIARVCDGKKERYRLKRREDIRDISEKKGMNRFQSFSWSTSSTTTTTIITSSTSNEAKQMKFDKI